MRDTIIAEIYNWWIITTPPCCFCESPTPSTHILRMRSTYNTDSRSWTVPLRLLRAPLLNIPFNYYHHYASDWTFFLSFHVLKQSLKFSYYGIIYRSLYSDCGNDRYGRKLPRSNPLGQIYHLYITIFTGIWSHTTIYMYFHTSLKLMKL